MSRPWLVLAFVSSVFSCVAQIPVSPDRLFERADRETVRRNPTAFPELPKNVLTQLQRRGCKIPQVPMVDGRQNVIKGEFAKPGQTDWAVLCSIGGVSSILIFWNGSEVNPTEIGKANDVDRLQGWGNYKIVYSRAISAAGEKYMMEHYNAYGGEKPPPIDHLGIDDAFVGKASVVLYFYRGKWLRLTGAD
jgi:hypothetical protein